jgi:hypothetical protein
MRTNGGGIAAAIDDHEGRRRPGMPTAAPALRFLCFQQMMLSWTGTS